MASSKVMPSSTSTNTDLVRQTSTFSLDLQTDQNKNFGSMSMDELMRNIYGDNPPSSSDIIIAPPSSDVVIESSSNLSNLPLPLPKEVSNNGNGSKTVDQVWKEISVSNTNNNDDDDVDRKVVREGGNEMTLEEFLTKAGAVREEDMKIPQIVGPVHGFVVDPPLDARFPQQGEGSGSGSIMWLGNGAERAAGRGKRRAILEPIDKVAQQRQRRMIKNRESAARSRERKQAYTVELESLVTQLEEENARLQREQEEQKRERLKQLMENVIPFEEKRRPQPRQVLRRACSAHW